jgi:hypothetical protein
VSALDNKREFPHNLAILTMVTALALAVIHQYLFYGNTVGISYPIFVALFYLYMFRDLSKEEIRQTPRFGWLLFAVILLLSMTFGLFDNPFFSALNWVVVQSLLFIHVTYLRGYRKREWWKLTIVIDTLNYLIPQSLRHVPTLLRTLKAFTLSRLGNPQKSALGKILIGLLIACPLLLIVVNLLASADGVFNRLLAAVPDWINSLSLGGIFGRLLWIAIFAVLFFLYLWGFIEPKRDERMPVKPDIATEEERIAEKLDYRIDPIIMTTILICVNAVYVLFVVVQFSYLFGAWDGVLPADQSYATYARSGFVELVVVSLINFAILIVGLLAVRKEEGKAGTLEGIISTMLYTLVGCSGVMLYSAYMRLVLYEEAYGYTYIRFLVHAFMIYLAILLIIAAIRIRRTDFPLAKIYIFISLLSYVLMNYIGMDSLIAKNNIERYRENGNIDASYLNSLSSGTIPLLIKFSREEYPAMKPYLELRRQRLSDMNSDLKWPSFNASRYRGEQALDEYLTQ